MPKKGCRVARFGEQLELSRRAAAEIVRAVLAAHERMPLVRDHRLV
jgi:hypothetical protein